MNFRSTLKLGQRALRWPYFQPLLKQGNTMPECQTVLRIAHTYFSSLQSKSDVHFLHMTFLPQRNYAVKKGAKKKGKEANAQVSLTGLGELIAVDDMVNNMESAIEAMKTEFIKSLSLRSAGSIETIKVKFEGKEYELQQVAKMTRKGQQTVVIDMLSFPQMTKAVMDTLKSSALNLNPQQEGTSIFVPIPKVTKEHREILAKKAKAIFVTHRDAIKKTQEENVKDIKGCDIGDSEKQSAYKQVRNYLQKTRRKVRTFIFFV